MQNVVTPKNIGVDNNRLYFKLKLTNADQVKYFKPTLPDNTEPSETNIAYAVWRLKQIQNDIDNNAFDPIAVFGETKAALNMSRFLEQEAPAAKHSILALLDEFIYHGEFVKAKPYSKETMASFNSSKRLYLVPFIKETLGADFLIAKLTALDVETYHAWLLSQPAINTIKAVKNHSTLLHNVCKHAIKKKYISHNPYLDAAVLEDVEDRPDANDADPYTAVELTKILATKNQYAYPEVIDMLLFTSWTGLSVSEVAGIAWEDIERKPNEVLLHIKRAFVSTQFRPPKEKSRARTISLMPQAIEYLENQRRRTFFNGSAEIEIIGKLQNRSTKEELRLVWKNKKSSHIHGAWNRSTLGRHYQDVCRLAGVRPRAANQCRHTYASTLITQGIPLEIIAEMMGHIDTTMVRKHYGKIIPEQRPNRALQICNLLGLEYAVNLQLPA